VCEFSRQPSHKANLCDRKRPEELQAECALAAEGKLTSITDTAIENYVGQNSPFAKHHHVKPNLVFYRHNNKFSPTFVLEHFKDRRNDTQHFALMLSFTTRGTNNPTR
jgi:hypothetical protein